MGHRKKHAPKRGSLAYLPRGRAAREVGRIRFWPTVETGPKLLGFMGYKAGMTHVFVIWDKADSPDFGKEVARPATVLDAPPIQVVGIRSYIRREYGLQTFTEAWTKNPPDDLERILTLPENPDPTQKLKKIEETLEDITEFRVISITQPKLASVPKKNPEVMEVKIDGGSIQEQFEYAKKLFGKIISVTEVFKEGQFIDIVSVSKGKGWQGPVKRWGVRILSRKSRKTKRGIATLGPWKPSRVLYTIPRAGQMGYSQRTEYNKRILKMGIDGSKVSPEGGFIRYGLVRGNYVLLDGSLPGPAKRLIRLRYPARPPKRLPEAPPKITQISLKSHQG